MPSAAAAIQELPKPTTDRVTGFPEPLSTERNTTLPHPSADTSPNATIVAQDVDPRLSHKRSRSFLSRKSSYRSHHKPGKSIDLANGTITVLPMPKNGEKGMYEDIEYADGTRDLSGEESSGSVKQVSPIAQSSGKEIGAGVSQDDDSSEDRDDAGHGEKKKRGLLRKLHRN